MIRADTRRRRTSTLVATMKETNPITVRRNQKKLTKHKADMLSAGYVIGVSLDSTTGRTGPNFTEILDFELDVVILAIASEKINESDLFEWPEI